MNNNTQYYDEEKTVRQFLTTHAHEPRPNIWFTKRLTNKLPARKSSICKTIMCIITFISVMTCGTLLYLWADYIIPPGENNITLSLLSIYIAMASTIILVTLHVIRLIKTYF